MRVEPVTLEGRTVRIEEEWPEAKRRLIRKLKAHESGA